MDIVAIFAERLNLFLIQLGLDQQLLNMGVTALEIAQGIVSLCGGFFLGMLVKRYCKMLFWVGMATGFIIFFLEYKSIVYINWTALNIFLGLAETATFDSVLTLVFEWLKQNVLVSVVSLIGFILGLKV